MGRAMALRFADLGAAVTINGRRPDLLAETVADIEEAGGTVTSSVSGNTDVLVVGENPGSKLQDAEDEGVSILRVDRPGQFEDFVERGLSRAPDVQEQ